MRVKMVYMFLILIFCPILILAQNKGSILVTINNLTEEKGTLRIGLFTENDKFLETPSYSLDIPVKDTSNKQFRFDSIPYGLYAISIYHDLDDNNELDSNFLGIPSEPVGFSNDHQPKMGPPKFKGAAFTLSSEELQLTVNLYTY